MSNNSVWTKRTDDDSPAQLYGACNIFLNGVPTADDCANKIIIPALRTIDNTIHSWQSSNRVDSKKSLSKSSTPKPKTQVGMNRYITVLKGARRPIAKMSKEGNS